jgi:hypothetical protein
MEKEQMIDVSAVALALRPHKPAPELPTYEVVLEGILLGRGFTRRYAVICRNWHIGFLGLPLPLEEVPEQRCDRQGKSWTVFPSRPDGLFSQRRGRR